MARARDVATADQAKTEEVQRPGRRTPTHGRARGDRTSEDLMSDMHKRREAIGDPVLDAFLDGPGRQLPQALETLQQLTWWLARWRVGTAALTPTTARPADVERFLDVELAAIEPDALREQRRAVVHELYRRLWIEADTAAAAAAADESADRALVDATARALAAGVDPLQVVVDRSLIRAFLNGRRDRRVARVALSELAREIALTAGHGILLMSEVELRDHVRDKLSDEQRAAYASIFARFLVYHLKKGRGDRALADFAAQLAQQVAAQ
jgi:hypothetical protein